MFHDLEFGAENPIVIISAPPNHLVFLSGGIRKSRFACNDEKGTFL